MSPLLQLPVIGAAIAPGRASGIITADSGNLTTEFMAQAGFPPPPNPIVVRGLQDQPEFRSAVFDEKGTIDPDLVEHRSEEHTSELQSLMRISYAVFCLKKKKKHTSHTTVHPI